MRSRNLVYCIVTLVFLFQDLHVSLFQDVWWSDKASSIVCSCCCHCHVLLYIGYFWFPQHDHIQVSCLSICTWFRNIFKINDKALYNILYRDCKKTNSATLGRVPVVNLKVFLLRLIIWNLWNLQNVFQHFVLRCGALLNWNYSFLIW